MKRRDLLALIGGAVAAPVLHPPAARAQQAMPVIGYLNATSPDANAHLLAAFHQALGETGYVVGRNVAIEYRWAADQNDRLPELAADLVRRQVAVIVATGADVGTAAAQAATTKIPIVFSTASDPVEAGLVSNLGRPGGNATGVSWFTIALAAKRFELLSGLVAKGADIGVLVNPTNPTFEPQLKAAEDAAAMFGHRIVVLNASGEGDFDAVFASLVAQKAVALFVTSDSFFNSERRQLVALAARHAMPASYFVRQFVEAGGLMSYSASQTDAYRQAGLYTGRILKGEKPGDLPVVQPTKFELVLNLKTARALGLMLPPNLLALADEVIE